MQIFTHIKFLFITLLALALPNVSWAQYLGTGVVGTGSAHGDIFRVSKGEIEILEKLCRYRTSYHNPTAGYGVSHHYDCPGGGTVVLFEEHSVAYVILPRGH